MSEIKWVARRDPVLAGEGAVVLLERLSPALEHVDSSSGAIGTAGNITDPADRGMKKAIAKVRRLIKSKSV